MAQAVRRLTELDPRTIHVRFLMKIWQWDRFWSEYFCFPTVSVILHVSTLIPP